MGNQAGCCANEGRGDGRLHPAWKYKPARQRPKTWSLDGLPPPNVGNARSIAAAVLADAKRGQTAKIASLIAAEALDSEQVAVLLGATDLALGNTALMLAAREGHTGTCQLLLELGADPAARNFNSKTAAELAILSGHDDIIALLEGDGQVAETPAQPAAVGDVPSTATPRRRTSKQTDPITFPEPPTRRRQPV